MKNATTFKKWYTSVEAATHSAYCAAEALVIEAAKQFFAGMYTPGGRMGYLVPAGGRAVRPSDFTIAWLPRAVLHAVLLRVCASHHSSVVVKFLRKTTDTDVLDISGGFGSSQLDDETAEEKLYEGGYMLQLRKAFSMSVRAAGGVSDPLETREARRAVFLAVKTATRHKHFQAMAITDDVVVEAAEDLDLEYTWDLTVLSAIGDSETLAYRRNEVYQQDQGDCEECLQGERCTLPKSKADTQSEGIVRLKRHRKGCPFEGLLGCSVESACARRSDGKLDARFRCQVCCKRLLRLRQGPRAAGGPAYVRLARGVQPSWEDAKRGEAGVATTSEEDFVYGEALEYDRFQLMFARLLPEVNRRRVLRGLQPYLARKWHWHGLRHGAAMNLNAMETPRMTQFDIAQWCRMSVRVLCIYLKHNRPHRFLQTKSAPPCAPGSHLG